MNDANRDLLLLQRTTGLSPAQLEYEVQQLNAILYHAETWASFCVANEILDVNRHKVIQDPVKMERMLRQKKSKPFVFTSGKN